MTIEAGKWRDWGVAPGEILAETLEEREMSQSELARRMGRPVKTINEIVNGKAAITTDTAIQLELALGISADVWNNLETSFRAHLSRERLHASLETHAEWAEGFPINDLVRAELIDRPASRAEKVALLLRYFGVSSPKAWEGQWQPQCASLRASAAHESSFPALTAWLRWGELVAGREEAPLFDAAAFRGQLPAIRSLTRQDPMAALEQAQEMCREAGVLVVLVPEFKETSLSGAARHLASRRALIQLSARHKTDDQLWFTFFHEAAHILEDRDGDRVDPANPAERVEDEAERAADQFARETLVDPRAFAEFREAGSFDEAEPIRRFAKEAGVSPGIVVGRLQREGLLSWSKLNDLKKRVRFE
jgi:addiction module HigA family antidote